MRIVLDATPLLGRRTGVGRYAHHLVRELPAALVRAGLGDVETAVSTWTARGGRLTDLPAGVRQVGPRVPARVLREAWLRWDHPRAEALVGRCAVFHGTNFVSPPSRHAREVLTVHDLTYELHRETVSADSLAYRSLVRRALRRGAHVVTPSRAVAEAVRDFYDLDAERVTPTPLGVEPAWFDATPRVPEPLAGQVGVDDFYLFVGSLDPRKNLARLVEAHAALRRSRPGTPPLVLAGPAGRSAVDGSGSDVHLAGWLDDDQLRGLVAASRALVLPSLDEGFGLPALEALAAGRPVVASSIDAVREVVGPHGLLHAAQDVTAIAGALEEVLGAPDDDAARAARRAHARGWTWAACADATVGAYGLG